VGIVPVAAGDKLWLAVTRTGGTGNPTIKHGNFSVIELPS